MSSSRPVLFLVSSDAGSADAGLVAADPDAPHVSVMDLGVTRGDGIFETISVCDGRAQALEPHLARFARSARILDLPEPDLALYRQTVLAAIDAHDDAPELYVKTVMTRGVEGTGIPTGWVYVAEAADFTKARTEGIRVVTLDRGLRHDVAETSPWLLQGAKTLSYAVNRAALREAGRRDADDVIFTSSDGYVLEGPTANVILRRGDTLVTPRTDQGILAGTTQASVFEFAASIGMATEYAVIPAAELAEADALWLVSSVRQAAPVNRLDGADREVDTELSARMTAYLLGIRD
jgi:4-amino-4-deoxychorismate lyase